MVMQMISKSLFKSHLLEYLRKVETGKKPLIITHGGKPVAKVIPYNEDADMILKSLQGSVITYRDPYDPVGEEDWEGLQ
jgi:prevent-host-death family protein